MNSKLNHNVKELNSDELRSISGGDSITRAFFSYLGAMAGAISAAMEAEAQHGVRVY